MNQPMMACPKCRATMHTHNRNGVHIEQCSNCRGIFLDFGELEALLQLQTQWMQQMAPQMAPQMPPTQMQPPPPAWGAPPPNYGHGYPHKHHKKGLMGMLFSS